MSSPIQITIKHGSPVRINQGSVSYTRPNDEPNHISFSASCTITDEDGSNLGLFADDVTVYLEGRQPQHAVA